MQLTAQPIQNTGSSQLNDEIRCFTVEQIREFVKTATLLELCEAEKKIQLQITKLNEEKNEENKTLIKNLKKSIKRINRRQKILSTGLGTSLGVAGAALIGVTVYLLIK